MLVIKRFRERKKIFRERKLSENFVLREEDVFSWLDEGLIGGCVFDGAFRGVGDEEVVVGEGVGLREKSLGGIPGRKVWEDDAGQEEWEG
ncbi:hypothetical protein Tco_0715517 [Tanacetum coccineum]